MNEAEASNGDKKLVVVSVLDLDELGGNTVEIHHLQAEIFADTVFGMNDSVTRLEIKKRQIAIEQRSRAFASCPLSGSLVFGAEHGICRKKAPTSFGISKPHVLRAHRGVNGRFLGSLEKEWSGGRVFEGDPVL